MNGASGAVHDKDLLGWMGLGGMYFMPNVETWVTALEDVYY